MLNKVKQLHLLVCLMAILGLATSCSKNMKDYPGSTVETSGEDGKTVVFKTPEGLYGVAKADDGEVIIKPEYGYITLSGNFIVANMSDAEYNDIVKKSLADAGIDEITSPEETFEKLDNIEKHEFITPGYKGSAYSRLFNIEGKMLKDYAFRPKALWIDTMGDTIVWETKSNNKAERDAYQLVSVSGEVIDIEDADFVGDIFTYSINESLSVKQKGKPEVILRGYKLRMSGGLYITHDKRDNFRYLRIYTPDAKEIEFDDKLPKRWTKGPSDKGIFVEIANKERERDIIYINEKGIISDIPSGYTINKSQFYNNVELIGPNGREVSKLYWKD